GVCVAPLAGTNPGFPVQQNSLRDVLLASLNFNIFARHSDRVRMANIAQMANVLQAMIMTDAERMVLTPTYHAFRMYVPFQDATYLPVKVDAGTYTEGTTSLPRVDSIGARDHQGRIWLAMTTLDARQSVRISVTLGSAGAHSARGEVLTAQHVDEVNSFEVPQAVWPKPFASTASGESLTLDVPARSLVVVQLE